MWTHGYLCCTLGSIQYHITYFIVQLPHLWPLRTLSGGRCVPLTCPPFVFWVLHIFNTEPRVSHQQKRNSKSDLLILLWGIITNKNGKTMALFSEHLCANYSERLTIWSHWKEFVLVKCLAQCLVLTYFLKRRLLISGDPVPTRHLLVEHKVVPSLVVYTRWPTTNDTGSPCPTLFLIIQPPLRGLPYNWQFH